MCIATVYVEEEGRKREVLKDVVRVEFREEGVLMVTLLGEERLMRCKVRSIDLVRGSILIEDA